MTKKLQKSYLRITALGIGIFGPFFSLGSVESTAALPAWSLDVLSWPVDGGQNYDAPTTRFLSALTGGFLFGWGVLVWCLQKWVSDVAHEAVRRSVLTSLVSWFFLDSAGSVASGNPSNVLFNVFVLLILAGPLWWKPAS